MKSLGLRIYRATTEKWCQMRKWFLNHTKVKAMEIETLPPFFTDFPNNKEICHCLCQIDIEKSLGWRIYWATTESWRQIWIWLEGSFKEFRVQMGILAAIFNWISKQQSILLLFLSDWYCWNLVLTDLTSHKGKLISDMNFILYQY